MVATNRRIMTCLLGLLTLAPPAAAQSPTERFWVGVSAGVQGTSNGFSDSFDFASQFQDPERSTASVAYPVKSGPLIDGTFAVRLWKGFAVGIGVSHFSKRADATVNAQVAHPFQFNQFRSIEGSTSTLRSETGVHLQFEYLLPLSDRFRVIAFAGPSWLDVEQTFVTDVQYSQTFPFDTASFSSAETRRSSATGTGGNVGADVIWMFARRFGVGGLIQYSAAQVDLDTGTNRTITVDAGGIQAGGGLRMVF
jgi:outer membrane protein with beta-barrel domain